MPIVDELVATVLSQHTSDLNSGRAFAELTRAFPSWEDVADATVEAIADAIKPGGLAVTKAPRIKAILQSIRRDYGRVDLSALEEMPDADVAAYLTSLPGIGPKSAACVLTFAMGRPAFPVDTHVYRVTRRLGLSRSTETAEQVQRRITPVIPEELRYEMHVQLIRHGRTICRARLPRCSECELFDVCDEGPRLVAAGAAG